VTVDEKTFVKLEEDMAAAIVANDADEIGKYLHNDWVIIGGEGRVITKADFLAVVRSGELTHSAMTFDDWRIRAFPDAAVATCRARATGTWQGEDFATHEISTSVYTRLEGKWFCIFTQLTPIPG